LLKIKKKRNISLLCFNQLYEQCHHHQDTIKAKEELSKIMTIMTICAIHRLSLNNLVKVHKLEAIQDLVRVGQTTCHRLIVVMLIVANHADDAKRRLVRNKSSQQQPPDDNDNNDNRKEPSNASTPTLDDGSTTEKQASREGTTTSSTTMQAAPSNSGGSVSGATTYSQQILHRPQKLRIREDVTKSTSFDRVS
jgi:hypothetical protein